MRRLITFLVLVTLAVGVPLAVRGAGWSSGYIGSLSSSDCKGIASKDKSYCDTNDCKGIASGDKSYCP